MIWFKIEISYVILTNNLLTHHANWKTPVAFMATLLFDIGRFMRVEIMMQQLIRLKLAAAKNTTRPIKSKLSPEGLWQFGVRILFALAFTRSQRLKGGTTCSLPCMSTSKRLLKSSSMISLASLVP